MSSPTARQAEIHEAVERHAGNYDAAGRDLGITGQAVGFSERRYASATGEPAHGTRRRPSRAEVFAALPDRMAELERHQESALASLAAIDIRLDRLAGLIEAFVARQPLLLEVRPAHRRIADGGRGGRDELRETRRGLRKAAGE